MDLSHGAFRSGGVVTGLPTPSSITEATEAAEAAEAGDWAVYSREVGTYKGPCQLQKACFLGADG